MGWMRLTADELAALLGARDPLVDLARRADEHAVTHAGPRSRLTGDIRLQLVDRLLAELDDPIRTQDSFFRARTLLRQAARRTESDPRRAGMCVRAALDSFEAHLEVGVSQPSAVHTRIAAAQLHLWAGIAAGLAGQDRHAADRLTAASARYRSLHDPVHAARATEELAELHRLAGDGDRADRSFARAVASFERAGDHHRAAQARLASERGHGQRPHSSFLTKHSTGPASTVLGSHEAQQIRACCTAAQPAPDVPAEASADLQSQLTKLTADGATARAAGERLRADGAPLPDVLRTVFLHDAEAAVQWAREVVHDGRPSVAVGALADVASPEQLADLVTDGDPNRGLTALRAGIDDPAALVAAARCYLDDEPEGLAVLVEALDAAGLEALAAAAAHDDRLLGSLAQVKDRSCLHQALAIRYEDGVARVLHLIDLIGLDAAANDFRSGRQDATTFVSALRLLRVDAVTALRAVRRAADLPSGSVASLLLEHGWPTNELIGALAQSGAWKSTLRWMADVVAGDQLLRVAREVGVPASQVLDTFGPKRKVAVSRLRDLGVAQEDLQALLESAGLATSAIEKLLNR